jgi:hypothetical protein
MIMRAVLYEEHPHMPHFGLFEKMVGVYAWWRGAAVAGVRRSACADRTVTQVKPLMMLARWNSPPRLTSRGDWPKPAPARAMVVSMVTAVPAL